MDIMSASPRINLHITVHGAHTWTSAPKDCTSCDGDGVGVSDGASGWVAVGVTDSDGWTTWEGAAVTDTDGVSDACTGSAV